MARKETGEFRNQVRTLQAKGYLTKDKADEIVGRYEEVIRGINGYIGWVKSNFYLLPWNSNLPPTDILVSWYAFKSDQTGQSQIRTSEYQ